MLAASSNSTTTSAAPEQICGTQLPLGIEVYGASPSSVAPSSAASSTLSAHVSTVTVPTGLSSAVSPDTPALPPPAAPSQPKNVAAVACTHTNAAALATFLTPAEIVTCAAQVVERGLVVPPENAGGAEHWVLPSCGCKAVDVFTLRTAPSVPFVDYAARIATKGGFSPLVLLHALSLTHRATTVADRHRHFDAQSMAVVPCPSHPPPASGASDHPAIRLTPFTAHRILAASLVLSAKTLHDRPRRAGFYAELLGCTVHDLAVLEKSLCTLLDGHMLVTAGEARALLRKAEAARSAARLSVA